MFIDTMFNDTGVPRAALRACPALQYLSPSDRDLAEAVFGAGFKPHSVHSWVSLRPRNRSKYKVWETRLFARLHELNSYLLFCCSKLPFRSFQVLLAR